MQPRIRSQFGVKRNGDEVALLYPHDLTLKLRQDLNVAPNLLDRWRADENCPQRLLAKDGDFELGFKGLSLPPECVSDDAYVH